MKPLAVFLQASSHVSPVSYLKAVYNIADPVISTVTATGDILVRSIKNGEAVEQTYPAGTNSLSVQADANTPISVLGSISALNISSANLISADVHGVSFTDAQFLNCARMNNLNTKKADNLASVKVTYASSLLSADFSNNKNLASIDIENCGAISNIKLPQTATLTSLIITSCPLMSNVDLSGITTLTNLSLDKDTLLSSVDLSQNTGLVSLSINEIMAMESIDVSMLVNLEQLMADNTYLSELDVRNCAALQQLWFKQPKAKVNILASGLQHLTLAGTPYSAPYGSSEELSVDVSDCPALQTLDLCYCTLGEIKASGCPSLQEIRMTGSVNVPVIDFTGTGVDVNDGTVVKATSIIARDGVFDMSTLAKANRVDIGFQNASISALKTIKTPQQQSVLSFGQTTYPALETLEIGNATGSVYYFTLTTTVSLSTLKARAATSEYATKVAALVTSSNVADGVAYLNSADPYYSTIETAALAKGWTIEPLA